MESPLVDFPNDLQVDYLSQFAIPQDDAKLGEYAQELHDKYYLKKLQSRNYYYLCVVDGGPRRCPRHIHSKTRVLDNWCRLKFSSNELEHSSDITIAQSPRGVCSCTTAPAQKYPPGEEEDPRPILCDVARRTPVTGHTSLVQCTHITTVEV